MLAVLCRHYAAHPTVQPCHCRPSLSLFLKLDSSKLVLSSTSSKSEEAAATEETRLWEEPASIMNWRKLSELFSATWTLSNPSPVPISVSSLVSSIVTSLVYASIGENEVAQQIPSVSEPQSKRHKRESPLEEAILKDLETETKASVVSRLHVDNPHAGEEVKEEVKDDPGHADKKSGVSMVIGCETSGEGNPGTIENMDKEEGLEEGEEDSDSAHESPVKPGILARLASSIFPFSFFFRDT
uniref:uncharacterized protein LOC124054793 isoform X6 n=1 Tax=Scatophagus argus TaxID=75038 RepID=UPI001ED808BE|nr:uncharacterized protein LOC124054793 isoform X6 [Scatophagus argus]